jgi:hypothetical protein
MTTSDILYSWQHITCKKNEKHLYILRLHTQETRRLNHSKHKANTAVKRDTEISGMPTLPDQNFQILINFDNFIITFKNSITLRSVNIYGICYSQLSVQAPKSSTNLMPVINHLINPINVHLKAPEIL